MSYLDMYSASLLLFAFWLSTVWASYEVGKRRGLTRQRSPLANNAATIARARGSLKERTYRALVRDDTL